MKDIAKLTRDQTINILDALILKITRQMPDVFVQAEEDYNGVIGAVGGMYLHFTFDKSPDKKGDWVRVTVQVDQVSSQEANRIAETEPAEERWGP